ncbi:MAG: hypothetical protein LBO09_08915 [Candidatus Peribacteria bacterium]|jgi:hypothetical protein|nr:hypothetical protein [Candidatus Peribacteria bacterium]
MSNEVENLSSERQLEQNRVMTYLSLFNEIDKHFDKVLKTESFLPYNDKIKSIVQGQYSISWFVKLFQNDLKYFGELRNHISHGLKVHEYLYAIPTQRAIDKLADFVDKIVEPPLCIDLFRKEVPGVQLSDSFSALLKLMREGHYHLLPVYDGKTFLGVVNESGMFQWLSQQLLDENFIDLGKIRIEHLPISTSHLDFVFVSAGINIYEADEIFTMKKKKGKGL